MATIWQKELAGHRYEVRQAGQSLRLYSNGVLHTQYHQQAHLTGSVWDLLMLPSLFYPQGQLRNALVLGVGGGAVIRQLKHFAHCQDIVGVDLNPVHLTVARRFFGCRRQGIELHQANAIDWLKKEKRQFDLIIDDLFADESGEPVRAVEMDRSWSRELMRHVSKDGALVVNQVHAKHTRNMALMTEPDLQKQFKSAFRFSTPHYDNSVSAWFKTNAQKDVFKQNLEKWPQLKSKAMRNRLRFTMRQIKINQ